MISRVRCAQGAGRLGALCSPVNIANIGKSADAAMRENRFRRTRETTSDSFPRGALGSRPFCDSVPDVVCRAYRSATVLKTG